MPKKIKRVYATADEIAEEFRPFFIEKDGKQILDIEVEGLTPTSRLDEFRQNSIAAKTELENLQEKYKDVDLDKYADLLKREKELSEHNLIKKGDVEAVLKQRVAEQTAPLKTQLQEVTKSHAEKVQQLEAQLADQWLQGQILEKALPMGLHETAVADLLMRAKTIFKRDEHGDMRAMERDGKTPRVVTTTGEPYTFEDFVADQSKGDGKHLFKESAGAGLDSKTGRSSGAAFNGVNPWDPKTENLTEQGRLMIKDFPLAERLAGKFGKKLKRPHSAATIPIR